MILKMTEKNLLIDKSQGKIMIDIGMTKKEEIGHHQEKKMIDIIEIEGQGQGHENKDNFN